MAHGILYAVVCVVGYNTKMVFRKQPAGTQRTLIYKIRVKPQFKEAIEKKLEWFKSRPGNEHLTVSDVIRYALAKYLQEPGDPREP
jgi:hypothetical protein